MYLLNINSRTVHDLEFVDGRCKISLIKEEHRMYFDNLNEALHGLPTGEKPIKKCSFCIR